jgi:hypothetical protein
MVQVKHLLVASLFVGGMSSISHAERFDAGRFEFKAPESSVEVNHRVGFASSAVDIEVRYGLYYEAQAYTWMAHTLAGNPASAAKYMELIQEPMGHDQKCLAAPERFEFQGYPAWRIVCSYSIKLRKMPTERHITESTIAVQRRWGYLVIDSRDDTEFVEQDQKKFDDFVANIKLLPEPPGGPWLLLVLLASVIAVLGGWFVSRRRRA